MKNVLLIFALLFILLQAEAQQRPQFSQYLFNGVYINPAYSGYKESLYLHSFFRSQWTGMEGAPKTMSLALDGAINDGKVGLSLLVNHDQVGAQLQTSAYANYAYKLKMGYYENARLAFGLGVGAVQLGLDGTRLHAAEEEDMIPTGMESKILPDARAGIF
ncbi:MAG TPA: PorP/SprF family type IX secretion system membrane protein, partial [Sphingobacteriaceae bacterium]